MHCISLAGRNHITYAEINAICGTVQSHCNIQTPAFKHMILVAGTDFIHYYDTAN